MIREPRYIVVQDERGLANEAPHSIYVSLWPEDVPIKVATVRGLRLANIIANHLNAKKVEPHQ